MHITLHTQQDFICRTHTKVMSIRGRPREARPGTVGGLLWVRLDSRASCQWVLVRALGEITHKDPVSYREVRKFDAKFL